MEKVGTPGSLPVTGKKTKYLENLKNFDRYVSKASSTIDFDDNTNPNTFDNSTY